MYIPRRYEESDRSVILSFIKENNFGILVTVKDGLPVATHIPMVVEKNVAGEDVLVAHISKGNDQKDTLINDARVLCIFPGPHAYISPRWYTALNVPTWNYISVHVYGTIRMIDGEELKAALSRLVNYHEHQMPDPMKMEEIPQKTFNDDFRGIVGFEIKITELQAAYKLSQNRDEKSFENVTQKLQEGDYLSKKVAEEMEKKSSQLFKHE